MTSMFDSAVYARRNHTTWARVNHLAFMKDMSFNGEGAHYEHAAKLSIQYRPDVASRFWWTIEWTGADGERHEQSAQELDLCLWRAAEAESRIEARLEAERKSASNNASTRTSGDAPASEEVSPL